MIGSSRLRRLLPLGAANLAVAICALAVVELVCRYLEPRPEQPPPVAMTLPHKKASELRVFAFGGPTVYGVPLEAVGFVAQMHYWLRRLYPERDIRVYNFGWAGVDTRFVLRQLTGRLDDRPDLIIVLTGHNEYLGPVGRTAGVRETILSHLAMARLVQRYRVRMKVSSKEYVMPSRVEPWNRDATTYKDGITAFETYLRLIIDRTRQRGVKLILGTLPSNIADWPPVYKHLAGRDDRYLDTVSRIQGFLRDGRRREAADAVDAAFGLYGEDAMLYFLRGRIQAASGAYADARGSFVKARDLDPLPWRASSRINAIIRAQAPKAGVFLVDLERVYEQRAQHDLVGFDFFYDNVHGNPRGESISAETLIRAMMDMKFLPPPSASREECCPVQTFLADVGFLRPKSPLRLRALLRSATYAMKTPWYNFEASRTYLLEALRVDDRSWEAWANLGTLSYLAGDSASGSRELRRAVELHGGRLDADDRNATPYLKEALDGAARRSR